MNEGQKLNFTTDSKSKYAKIVRSSTFVIQRIDKPNTYYLGRLDDKGKNPLFESDILTYENDKWILQCRGLCIDREPIIVNIVNIAKIMKSKEEVPSYILKAVTPEVKVHPQYGKLRY